MQFNRKSTKRATAADWI